MRDKANETKELVAPAWGFNLRGDVAGTLPLLELDHWRTPAETVHCSLSGIPDSERRMILDTVDLLRMGAPDVRRMTLCVRIQSAARPLLVKEVLDPLCCVLAVWSPAASFPVVCSQGTVLAHHPFVSQRKWTDVTWKDLTERHLGYYWRQALAHWSWLSYPLRRFLVAGHHLTALGTTVDYCSTVEHLLWGGSTPAVGEKVAVLLDGHWDKNRSWWKTAWERHFDLRNAQAHGNRLLEIQDPNRPNKTVERRLEAFQGATGSSEPHSFAHMVCGAVVLQVLRYPEYFRQEQKVNALRTCFKEDRAPSFLERGNGSNR